MSTPFSFPSVSDVKCDWWTELTCALCGIPQDCRDDGGHGGTLVRCTDGHKEERINETMKMRLRSESGAPKLVYGQRGSEAQKRLGYQWTERIKNASLFTQHGQN